MTRSFLFRLSLTWLCLTSVHGASVTADSGAFVVCPVRPPDQLQLQQFLNEATESVLIVNAGEETISSFVKAHLESKNLRITCEMVSSLPALEEQIEQHDATWIVQMPVANDVEKWGFLRFCSKMVDEGKRIGVDRTLLQLSRDSGKKHLQQFSDPTVDALRSPLRLRVDDIQAADPTYQTDDRLLVRLDDNAMFFLSGRRCWVTSGMAHASLPASDSWVNRKVALTRSASDLVALQRRLRFRNLGLRPLKEMPVVPNGTLLLVGGGRISSDIVERFVSLAGGMQARIVVLPTASADPIPSRISMAESLRKAGAGEVVVLRDRKRGVVESQDFLTQIGNATAIWFGGGRQWRFVDAYEGTKAESAFHQLLARGGVIGGSSAGASIQADYLVRGNPLGNVDAMSEGYERGFAFLPGTAVDQHFSQRNRMSDLISVVQKYPSLLGIGIDESTGVFVSGTVGEVVGAGNVYFISRQLAQYSAKKTDPELPTVTGESGDRFDLVELKRLN